MNKAIATLLTIATLLCAQGCGNRMWEDGKDAASGTFNYVFDTAPTARAYHET